ncbi:MAG: hypothetical protein M0T83_00765 [Nitrospiraceae bacterium]|nr:hypothetical protein [Nitrospiraceae bacterium]
MPVYSLVSRDPDHSGEIDLWHPERIPEEEFGELVLEAMQWTSSATWREQIFEVGRYLIEKHGFSEAGGVFRISYPSDWSKQAVRDRLRALLAKDRSD